jgi:hypothetical protein
MLTTPLRRHVASKSFTQTPTPGTSTDGVSDIHVLLLLQPAARHLPRLPLHQWATHKQDMAWIPPKSRSTYVHAEPKGHHRRLSKPSTLAGYQIDKLFNHILARDIATHANASLTRRDCGPPRGRCKATRQKTGRRACPRIGKRRMQTQDGLPATGAVCNLTWRHGGRRPAPGPGTPRTCSTSRAWTHGRWLFLSAQVACGLWSRAELLYLCCLYNLHPVEVPNGWLNYPN